MLNPLWHTGRMAYIGGGSEGGEMKLTGPVRLGIVAYAVWLLLVGWSAYGPVSAVMERNAARQTEISSCLAGRTDFGAEAECGAVWMVGQENPNKAPLPVTPYLLAALAPPIFAFLGLLAFRWVRRGFEAGPSN